MLLTWSSSTLKSVDTLPVWLCQIMDFLLFSSPSLYVCQHLCVSVCLFFACLLCWKRKLRGSEGIKGIRENQPIVKGWHDGRYCCMMANYNLFFTICVGAAVRISKSERSAFSLMAGYGECFSSSQRQRSQCGAAVFQPRQLVTKRYKWVLKWRRADF